MKLLRRIWEFCAIISVNSRRFLLKALLLTHSTLKTIRQLSVQSLHSVAPILESVHFSFVSLSVSLVPSWLLWSWGKKGEVCLAYYPLQWSISRIHLLNCTARHLFHSYHLLEGHERFHFVMSLFFSLSKPLPARWPSQISCRVSFFFLDGIWTWASSGARFELIKHCYRTDCQPLPVTSYTYNYLLEIWAKKTNHKHQFILNHGDKDRSTQTQGKSCLISLLFKTQ